MGFIIIISRPPPPPLPKSQPPILLSVGCANDSIQKSDDGITVHDDGESGTKSCNTLRSLRVEKDKDLKSQQGRMDEIKCTTVSGKEQEKKVEEVSNSDQVKESQQEVPVNVPNVKKNQNQYVWFRPDLTRAAAEEHLLSNNLPDGSFLIRPGASSHTFPHSLSLLFDGRVYHLNIRKVMENHEESCPSSGSTREMFSLGKGTNVTPPGRCFETLEQLVQFYANKPLLLVSTRNRQQQNNISQGSDRRKQVKLLQL